MPYLLALILIPLVGCAVSITPGSVTVTDTSEIEAVECNGSTIATEGENTVIVCTD